MNKENKKVEEAVEIPRRMCIEPVVITRKNINKFFIVNPRRIRKEAARGILRQLLAGNDHFEEPVHLAYKNANEKGGIAVINGHHRIVAIKKFLDKNPNGKVVVDGFFYESKILKNKKLLIALYDSISKGTPEGSEDFLKKHRVLQIPTIETLINDLPVTLDKTQEGEKDKVLVKSLIDAYIMSKRKKFPGTSGVKKHLYPMVAKSLSDDDINSIIETMHTMIEIYAENCDYLKTYPFKKTTTFYNVFNVIERNKYRLPRNYIVERVRNKLTPDFLSAHCLSGATACKKMFNELIEELNKGKRNETELFYAEMTE